MKLNKFSVSLGLLDYINPILYTITAITIIKNINMTSPYSTILIIGAIISIVFGFIIPTGKILVGLNIIKFRMPVILVLMVNIGLLLTGTMLIKHTIDLTLLFLLIILLSVACILYFIYDKNKKLNTIAVLIGAAGYLFIYTSLIIMSIIDGIILPIFLYAIAIILFVMLCGIGIKANLKNPITHWIIEISNVVCQLLVAIATVLLFK